MTGSLPFWEGTFSLPSLGALYLSSLGYSNVSYESYSESSVVHSLINNRPVFINSIPSTRTWIPNISYSHAWNIDGYRLRYTTTTYYYLNGVLDHTSSTYTTANMFHCAWGWGGYCDGYFPAGVFKLSSSSNLYDNPDDANNDELDYYKYYLHTISYSLPL